MGFFFNGFDHHTDSLNTFLKTRNIRLLSIKELFFLNRTTKFPGDFEPWKVEFYGN